MIYCNLVSSDSQSAVYDFGMNIHDLSGRVIFYKDNQKPEIIELPKEGEIALPWLRKLNARCRKDFSRGIFKKKVSYECG